MKEPTTESTDSGKYDAGVPDRRAPIDDGRYMGPERRADRREAVQGPTLTPSESLTAKHPTYHDLTGYPNAATQAAIADSYAGNVESYPSADAMFAELDTPLSGFPQGFGAVRPAGPELDDSFQGLDRLQRRANEVTEELCGIPKDVAGKLEYPYGVKLSPQPPTGHPGDAWDGPAFKPPGDAWRAERGIPQEVKPETRENNGPYVSLLAGFGKALPYISEHIVTCARSGYDGGVMLDALTEQNPWPPERRVLRTALAAWEALAKLELMLRLGADDS